MDARFPRRLFLRLLHRRPQTICHDCLLKNPHLLWQAQRQWNAHARRSFHATAAPANKKRPYKNIMGLLVPDSPEKQVNKPAWHIRDEDIPPETLAEFLKFPLVTADGLRTRIARPRRVKMLMRDFVEDSLYNPYYGYFPKEAYIFSPTEPINFTCLDDNAEFDAVLKHGYDVFEDELDDGEPKDARQLWHTPSEIFQPHYGEAIARYMASNYKVSSYPYYDLVIYEMGAGNGTLMLNILDYLRRTAPEIYERTQYKVIEISSSLAAVQESRLISVASEQGHGDRVEIINKSIFDWDQYVNSPAFFIALEVFDNFAHDAIRYDSRRGEAMQTSVIIDGSGEMYETYSKRLDPVALRYLKIRDMVAPQAYKMPGTWSRGSKYWNTPEHVGEQLYVTAPEYIPTRLMQFFDILHNYFPGHKLISSDFHQLPTLVPGTDAPVVQTRYKRETVPVKTPLVFQGRFDIMFPTNFAVAEAMYRAITGKLTRSMSHEDFLQRWAFVEDTETKSGENPMLSYYKNASVMVTV